MLHFRLAHQHLVHHMIILVALAHLVIPQTVARLTAHQVIAALLVAVMGISMKDLSGMLSIILLVSFIVILFFLFDGSPDVYDML